MKNTIFGENRWEHIKECKDEICHGKTIALLWTTDDVHGIAEENDIELTEEQAIKVLENIESHHNACCGVNWDTIESTIDYTLENWEE